MADNVIETGRSRIEDILLKASNGEALSRIEEILLTLYNDLVHLGPDGLIPAELIPPQVFERMKTVIDDAARFALTTDDVQDGDWVYVNSSQIMYFVSDEDHLDTEAGYTPVAAGIAAKAVADKDGNQIDTTYQTKLTFDAAPTQDSTNPVTSGGVYTALSGKQSTIDSDHKLSSDLVDDTNSTNKFATQAQLDQIGTNQTNILLKANTTDVNAATSNLQAQINQIITPVTQDAEVQNARIADDTTYDTLKERLDAENNYITDDLKDVETWLGYPINYFNANNWKITNSSNWELTTTRSSVIINHKTTYSTGYPTITLNVPQGSYKFSANLSESSVKVFGLYIDGTYSKNITNGDTITVENGKVYRLTFGSSAIAEYTITDMKLVPITANGEIQKINAEIEDINTMLSDIEFDYVYKLAEIAGEEYKFIMPDGSTGTAQGQGYKATDYVALNSTSIKVTCSANYGNNLYAFYDTNKTFISGYLANAGSSLTELKNQEVSVPNNAIYVRLAWIESSGGTGSLEILTPIIVLDDSLAQKSLDNKKWCVIGDSLTEVNNQAEMKYYDYLAYPTTTFANLGKSGTGFLQTYSTYENFVDRVDALDGTEGYDVISVMGGINDSGNIGTDYQLGQLGDTEPTTIYGAIYYVFNSLITKYPLSFIFAILEPITEYRHNYDNNIDVIQNAVKEVCAWLKIPVADANHASGLRPWIAAFKTEYYYDGTHPNAKGHYKIANAISDIFKLNQ